MQNTMQNSPNRKSATDKVHVIELKAKLRSDTLPSVVCSCGWVYGPNSSLLTLGRHAKNHSMETGHQLRHHSEEVN